MRCAVASIGSMHEGSNSPIPALMLRSGAEFRTRLVEGQAEEQLLTVMLTLFKQRGWRNRPWQSADGFDAGAG